MKIIKIILTSLLALGLIIAAGVFIFFQVFQADQYFVPIAKKASLALGRPVTLGSVGLGLSGRGITLDVGPLIIADDPAFSSQPFVKIDRIRIGLDFRSLILRREIHATDILLESPQIHFIRSQDGDINIRSLFQVNQPLGNNAEVKNLNEDVVEGKANHSFENGENKDDSLVNSGNLQAKMGGLKYFQSVTIQDASISFIDQAQAFPVDIWLTGTNASLKGFSLSKPLGVVLDTCFYSHDPNVHLSTSLSYDLLKRSIHVSDLNVQTNLSHIDINLLKWVSPHLFDNPIFKNIVGVVQLNIEHLDRAPSGGINLTGQIIITDGGVKNFNVIQAILSHTLGSFGWIEGNIEKVLNGQLKDKLDAKDTIIDKADVKFSVHDKSLFIDDCTIQTNIFEFTAHGSVDQGLNTDMQTMLHLNGDVSDALVNQFDGFKHLMDDSKRIAIDASLKGVIPYLKYKPSKDFRKKSKKALIEEGGNILNILFK